MKIRFVQVILDNGTEEVLATNVLDNERLRTSDFKELYNEPKNQDQQIKYFNFTSL